jgi:hypothetical protein
LGLIEADDVQVGATFVWEDDDTLPTTTSRYDPSCEMLTGAERMYHFTVPPGGAGTYLFTTDTPASVASGVNTVMDLRTFCHTEGLGSLGCSDDVGGDVLSRLVVPDLAAGDEMYILVDGLSSADNGLDFGITWGLVAQGAENDACGGPFQGCGPGLVCLRVVRGQL